MAQSELARVSQIASQSLRFYRQNSSPSRSTISAILDSVADLYQRRFRTADIKLERRYSTQEAVMVFVGELRQVVANLVGNSLDAIGSKGRIVLKERKGTDWRSGRRGIRVTVADTGHGISSETMRRIFDPFFTTKAERGTGLGLWVSKEIVEKHCGKIHVRSSQHESHRGTVFTVFLPEIDSESSNCALSQN
jgi:signal transduction histidine kinase